MAKCVNISSEEFKSLQQTTLIPTLQLEVLISNWQTNNNTDEFPSVETVLKIFNNDVKKLNSEDFYVKDKYFPNGNITSPKEVLTRMSVLNHKLSPLAKKLIDYSDVLNTTIELVDEEDPRIESKAAAHYDRIKNQILLKTGIKYKGNGVEPILLHEIIHGLTVKEIRYNSLSKEVEDLNKLYEHAKKYISEDVYGMKDIYEFVAELFTNAAFINKLKDVPSTQINKYKNLFQEFFDIILELFKIKKNSSLYEQAFELSSNIIDNQYQKFMLEKDSINNTQITEDNFNEPKFPYMETISINKDTKLWKKLHPRLPESQAKKIYTLLNSTSFDNWYGNAKRDSEGMPIINNAFQLLNDKGETRSVFKSIEFTSTKEVERFLSSNKTVGISKFGNKYYVSKNQRISGIKWINLLEKNFPGLINLKQSYSESQEIGVKDQSMPIIRIDINQDYFNNQIFNIEQAVDVKEKIKSDPREYIINRLEEANIRIGNKLKDAKRDAKKTKNNSEVIKYEKIYERNKENLINLKTDQTKSSIIEQARVDLNVINKGLKKGTLTMEELSEIGNLIDLYKGIDDNKSRSGLLELEDLEPRLITKIDSEGNEYEEEDITNLTKSIQKTASDYRLLENRYNDIIKQVVTKEYNKQYNAEETVKSLFKDVKDLGFLAGTRDTGSINNKLLNLMHFVRSTAIERSNAETLADQRKREKMSDGLKKSKLFKNKQDFMKLFWQKDEKGDYTRGLVNKFSDKYWQFRKKYLSDMQSKDKTKIAKAKKEHYNNHEYINYFETEEEKQLEINRLASIFTLDRATELVEDQDLRFEEYRVRREEKFEDIDGEDLTLAEKELEKEIWELQNNPKYTIENLKNGTVTSNPKGGNIYNSFEFVKPIPLKYTRKGNKETGFYDSNFELIENDPIALEYYNYVKDTIKDLLRQYPQSYLSEKGIHEGFIPMVTKEAMSDMVKKSLKSGLSGLNEITRDLYTIKTFSKTHNHINPSTGGTMNTLNISMLAPKYKTVENGKVLNTEDIITDLDEILKIFIPVTNLYKHKTRIEGTFNLIGDSIKLLKGVQESPTGTLIRNKDGETVLNNLSKLNEMVKHEIDTFYNQQEKESASKTKKLTKEEKEQELQLKDEISNIEETLSKPDLLTEAEEERLIQQKLDIETKLSDLGQNVSASKSVKSVLKWYQLLSQGWNVTSPVIELFYGFMSNFTHATGNVDYTGKQIRRAYRIAQTAILSGGTTKQSKKFNNIIEKFNIVGDVHEYDTKGAINSNLNKIKVKNIIKPYELARLADKMSKGSSAIAVMMNINIEDINGNTSNLYDAMDENGNLKSEFQTEDNLKNWTLDIESTVANDLERTRQKIIQINKRNHGNYDPNSPIPFNSSAGGKAVLQFRRWLLEGVASRWENERFDPNLGRTIKGRYRTYGKAFVRGKQAKEDRKAIVNSLLLLISRKLINRKVTNEELEELGLNEQIDIENMRKNATGLMFTISMFMMLVLMKSLSDDDEDKDFSTLKFLTNMGGRLQQDLWFYANPGEGSSLLSNIVPAMKLYDKIDLWREACWQTLFETDPEYNTVYQSGQFKGTDKWLIKTGELIPGSASVIKTYRLGKSIL